MMYLAAFILSFLPFAKGVNVVLSNDDGWAEINIRTFFDSLTAGGNSVVLSAPADNKSGTGSTDTPPTERTTACEFNSCPASSPAEGFNASMPRFNYVNSYPVTSMRYGIQNLSSQFFCDAAPDIAVAGPNVGANLGSTTLISGTVGAATEAAKEGFPAIAFSGSTGSQTAWTVSPVPSYSTIYADLSANVTDTLVQSEQPYLPSGTWLNVNFPSINNSGACSTAGQVRFVLSRINSAGSGTGRDVTTCSNNGRLPTESSVVNTSPSADGTCYASISVGIATTKGDATEADQATVLSELSSILSCLPS